MLAHEGYLTRVTVTASKSEDYVGDQLCEKIESNLATLGDFFLPPLVTPTLEFDESLQYHRQIISHHSLCFSVVHLGPVVSNVNLRLGGPYYNI